MYTIYNIIQYESVSRVGNQGAFAQEGKQLDLGRGRLRDAAAIHVINQLHVAIIIYIYLTDISLPTDDRTKAITYFRNIGRRR